MGSDKATAGSARDWLTPRQVAKRLGWDVKTIRARCASGHIPHQRLGDGPIRIRRTWVEEQERRAA